MANIYIHLPLLMLQYISAPCVFSFQSNPDFRLFLGLIQCNWFNKYKNLHGQCKLLSKITICVGCYRYRIWCASCIYMYIMWSDIICTPVPPHLLSPFSFRHHVRTFTDQCMVMLMVSIASVFCVESATIISNWSLYRAQLKSSCFRQGLRCRFLRQNSSFFVSLECFSKKSNELEQCC